MKPELWDLILEKGRALYYQRICPVCTKDMINEACEPQWAHRIPQTKENIKKYGKEVIHHRFNRVLVCSLKCNDAVLLNPATHPVEAARLIKEIQEDLKK